MPHLAHVHVVSPAHGGRGATVPFPKLDFLWSLVPCEDEVLASLGRPLLRMTCQYPRLFAPLHVRFQHLWSHEQRRVPLHACPLHPWTHEIANAHPSTVLVAAQTSTSPSSILSGQPSSSSLTEDQRSERPPLCTSSSSCSPSSSILSSHHSSSPPPHTDQQPSKEEAFEEPPSCSLPVESALLPDGHTLCVGDVVWGR